MLRRCPLLTAALLCPLLAPAAPVPKETPTEMVERVYGEVVDTDSKAKCEPFGKDGLKVTATGGSVTGANSKNDFRPLIAREVEDDFVLTVQVTPIPVADASTPEGHAEPVLMAGLTLYGTDAEAGVELLFICTPGNQAGWIARVEMTGIASDGAGYSFQGRERAFDGKPLRLRLTRRGDEYTAGTSKDGRRWTELGGLSTKRLGSVVKVGPTAVNRSKSDYAATFDRYELKLLPAKAGDGKK